MTIKATVRAGRLLVDEPTRLLDGTEVELLPLDPGDWLDEADRAALHEALARAVTERRVRFTATASQHIKQEQAWWMANRDHQDLFATEIEDAIRIVAVLPGAGTPYADAATPELRRLYLRKLAICITPSTTRKSSSELSGVRSVRAGQSSNTQRALQSA